MPSTSPSILDTALQALTGLRPWVTFSWTTQQPQKAPVLRPHRSTWKGGGQQSREGRKQRLDPGSSLPQTHLLDATQQGHWAQPVCSHFQARLDSSTLTETCPCHPRRSPGPRPPAAGGRPAPLTQPPSPGQQHRAGHSPSPGTRHTGLGDLRQERRRTFWTRLPETCGNVAPSGGT